jgi:hypothetical protein
LLRRLGVRIAVVGSVGCWSGRLIGGVTGHAGVAVVAELDRVLGISSALDGAVGSIKTRRRGGVRGWVAAIDGICAHDGC